MKFLSPGPLEVQAGSMTSNPANQGKWFLIQRIKPYVIESTAVYRPGGSSLAVSVSGYGLGVGQGIASAWATTTPGSPAAGVYWRAELVAPTADATGGSWDDASLFDNSTGILTLTAAASIPVRSGKLVTRLRFAMYYYRYYYNALGTVLYAMGSVDSTATSTLLNSGDVSVGIIAPTITTTTTYAALDAFTATNIVITGYQMFVTTGAAGSDSSALVTLMWDDGEMQTFGGATNPCVGAAIGGGAAGRTTLTCPIPAGTKLKHAGDARVELNYTRTGYTPRSTSGSFYLFSITPALDATPTSSDYPASGTISLAVNGAGLRGSTPALGAGTAGGSCSSSWVVNAAGTTLTCSTFNLAGYAGTVAMSTSAPSGGPTNPLVSGTVTTNNIRPVLTSSTTPYPGTTGTLTVAGYGLGNDSTVIAVSLSNGANSLSGTTTSSLGTAGSTVTGRITAGTQASFDITTAPRDAGPFYATVTVNGVASTSQQIGVWTPTLSISSNTYSADTAISTYTFVGTAFGPTVNATLTPAPHGGACTCSGNPTAAAPNWSITCPVTTQPRVAGDFYVTVGPLASNLYKSSSVLLATVNPVVVATPNTNIWSSSTTFTITGYGLGSTTEPATFSPSFDLTGVTCNSRTAFLLHTPGGAPGSVTCQLSTSSFSNAGILSLLGLSINGKAVTATPYALGTVWPNVTSAGAVTVNYAASFGITVQGTGLAGTTSITDPAISIGTIGTSTSFSCTFLSVATGGTSLTCTVSGIDNAGVLTGTVTVSGLTSTRITLANIRPIITPSTATLVANAASLSIAGTGLFDGLTVPSPSFGLVSGTAMGSLMSCTPGSTSSGSFPCTIGANTKPTHSGALFASISVGGVASTWAQVATIQPFISVASPGNRTLPGISQNIAISGFGLCGGTTSSCGQPTFSWGPIHTSFAPCTPTGVIASGTGSSFNCNPGTSGTTAGSVMGTVTANTVPSSPALMFISLPSVTATTLNTVPAAASATINIDGLGFQNSVTAVSVTFESIAGSTTPTCIASITSNIRVVCTGVATALSGPLRVQSLAVTISGVQYIMPTLTQVASITPVITAFSPQTFTYAEAVAGLTINVYGYGLAPNGAGSLVVSDRASVGAAYSVVDSVANGTYINVRFTTPPNNAGDMTVRVTANSVNSPDFVLCKIRPSVNPTSTFYLPADGVLASNIWRLNITGGPFSAGSAIAFDSTDVTCATGTTVVYSSTLVSCLIAKRPLSAGTFTATVTSNSVASASQSVATFRPAIDAGHPTPVSLNGALGASLTLTGYSLTGLAVVVGGGSYQTGFTCNAQAPTVTDSATNKQSVLCTISSVPRYAGPAFLDSYTGASSIPNPSSPTFLPKIVDWQPWVDTASASVWDVSTSSFNITGLGFTAPLTVLLNNSATCDTAVATTPETVLCTINTPSRKPSQAGPMSATITVQSVAGVATTAVYVKPYISAVSFGSSFAFPIAITNTAYSGIVFTGLALANADSIISSNGYPCTPTSRSSTGFTCSNVRPTVAGAISFQVVAGGQTSTSFAVSGGVIAPLIVTTVGSVQADATSFTVTGHGLNCLSDLSVTIQQGGQCTPTSIPTSYTFNTPHTFACTLSTTNRMTQNGALRISITCNGVSNFGGPTQVGNVIPVLTGNPQIAANIFAYGALPTTITWDGIALNPPSGTSLVDTTALIDGSLRSPTGATGLSCQSASVAIISPALQRLTCTLQGSPAYPGAIAAVMGASSLLLSAPKNVTYIAPAVTASTTFFLGQSAPSLTISGFGLGISTAEIAITVSMGAQSATCAISDLFGGTQTGQTVTCTLPTSFKWTTTGTLNAVASGQGIPATPVSVATVTADPEINVLTALPTLAVNAPRFTIAGRNFGTAGTNRNFKVDLTPSSFTCVPESYTDTEIVCLLSNNLANPPASGTLSAVVTRNGGAGVVTGIYTLVPRPILTAVTDGSFWNTTSIVLRGNNFGNSGSKNDIRVTLTVGASTVYCAAAGQVCSPTPCTCTITDATTTTQTTISTISITFPSFTVTPPYQAMMAQVIRASGPTDTVQVRTLGYPPTVDASNDILSTLAQEMTITGANFYKEAPEKNVVILSSGQCVPRSATHSSIVCQIQGTPLPPGQLSVLTITSNLIKGELPPVVIRNVLSVPVIFPSTRGIQINSNRLSYSADPVVGETYMVIRGSGFSTSPGDLTVNITHSAMASPPQCTVDAAYSSYILCFFPAGGFPVEGRVFATVKRGLLDSGLPIQIGTVRPLPQLSPSSVEYADVATEIPLSGVGFSEYDAADNFIEFNQTGVSCVPKTGTQSRTGLNCTISGKLSVGVLGARIQVDDLRQSSTDFVPVARIVLNPDVVESVRSVATGTSSFNVAGQGFVTPAAANIIVVVSSTESTTFTCTVTSANATSMTFTVSPTPAQGEIRVTSICANSVCNNFATPRPIATVRDIPTVAGPTGALPIINAVPNSVTLRLQGSGFSTNPADNYVALSSGTCTVATNPPPTATEITCIINPFEFASGVLTAQVTVQGGVTSTQVPLATYKPLLPSLSTQRKIPIDIQELIIPAYYLTENTSAINSVVLSRGAGGASAAECTVVSSTRTSVSCEITTPFTRLGDFDAQISLYLQGETSWELFTTARAVAGTVVPALYDHELTVPANTYEERNITLFGAGFKPHTDIAVTVSPADADPVSCVIIPGEISNTEVNCTLMVPINHKAGDFFISVTVTDQDIVLDSYTSSDAMLVTIVPVVEPVVEQEFLVDGFVISIVGVGFSDIAEENAVTLVPSGLCIITNSSITSIECTVIPNTVANGPLFAYVGVRNVFTPSALSLGNVTLNYVAPPLDDAPYEAPTNATDAPVDEGVAPQDGSSVLIPVGTITGIVVGIVLGVIVVIIIVWAIVGTKRYGSLKEAFTGPFSGGAAAAYKGGRAPRKKAAFKARATQITPPYNPPAPKADDDVPPPPPPEEDDVPPPPPEEDDGTTFEMQRFGTLRVNPEEIFANADDGDEPPPPPEDDEDDLPPPPEDEDDDAPPPPPDDDDPFGAASPSGGDIDVDNIFD